MRDTSAWRALAAHRDAVARQRIDALWREDARRGEALTFSCGGIAVDFSKQKVTRETLRLLLDLARECRVPHAVERLFAGDRVNSTEKRPALHMALRGDEHVNVDGTDVMPEIERNRDRMRVFTNAVRAGQWKGATGLKITHVVAIGIGGSALGPQLAIEALRDRANGPEVRFIANIDPADFDDAIAGLKPASTLVVVASKTFTTQETMVNAAAARAWIAAALGPEAVAKHIIGATANAGEAVKWGLPDCNVFPFHDWVGGRYSLWSSVGIPIALAVGMQGFEELLAGAHAVDLAFRSDALERNVPVLLALVGIWNRNALGIPSHAVLGYASRLASLPAYLQQLEMESNGKRVDAAGHRVDTETCPVIWGGTETPGQHAFHQWLHQGTDIASCDFIVSARPMGSELEHHRILLANACAQSEALMAGVEASEPWRTCPGDRMSTTFVLPHLDARHLGALLAIYEHKVFVQATIWGINPFDQFGVELGKTIAGRILPALRGSEAELHPATRHLLGVIGKLGGPH
ncbi:MAG TPA: glucose-6-phosphate isomerase [Usitatibacter sp.]|jgi:glucose-6-phosphate isomerase|nr:glucose-6-phosphate isomerase [Usitatibacter sp.]